MNKVVFILAICLFCNLSKGQKISFNVYPPFFIDTIIDFKSLHLYEVYKKGLRKNKNDIVSYTFKNGLIHENIIRKFKTYNSSNVIRDTIQSSEKNIINNSDTISTIYISNNRLDSAYYDIYKIYYDYDSCQAVNYRVTQYKKKYFDEIFGSYQSFQLFPVNTYTFKKKYNSYLNIYIDEGNKEECYLINKSIFTDESPRIIIRKFAGIKVVKFFKKTSITTKGFHQSDDNKKRLKTKTKIIVKVN